MASKSKNPYVTASYAKPKKRRPGRHSKKPNKQYKPKNFFG